MTENSFILAYLLKQVMNYHRKNTKALWAKDAMKIINNELRLIPTQNLTKANLTWSWLKKQRLDTAQIYLILIQLALDLTENEKLFFYTTEYEDLLKEFINVIEKQINPEEWDYVKKFSLYYYIN